MLGKPRILSLFPNSFNKFNKHEHSCKILYEFIRYLQHMPDSGQNVIVDTVSVKRLLYFKMQVSVHLN